MSSTQAAVGIDLGVQQACIGILNNKKEVEILPAKDRQLKTPTSVSYSFTSPNTFTNLVGTDAVTAMSKGQLGVYDVKRILGRSFGDPEVQKFIQDVPFQVVNENGAPKVEMHYSYWKNEKKLFHAEEIIAKILKHLKARADERLQTQTKKVVLTVPATFDYQQRTAAQDSAILAGFSSVEIITEATAAVICYLESNAKMEKNILVFDLGMCTFDLTLLKVVGKEITVLAAGGDNSIGGKNFTDNMVGHATKRYQEKHGGEEYDPNYIDKLRANCELKKKELFGSSNCESVQVSYAGYILGNSTFTRETFKQINLQVFTNISAILNKFLEESAKDILEIDHVILVGGSTRIPLIIETIKAALPKAKIMKEIDVETIVAKGASIQANSSKPFTEHFDLNTLRVFQAQLVPKKVNGICTPAAIGVLFEYAWQIKENKNSNFGILIDKGTEIPCFAENKFWFPQEGRRVRIRIFEGNHTIAEENDEIGSIVVDGIRTDKEFCQIKIQMYLSANGELKVRAAYSSWIFGFQWNFATFDILEARKSNHFYIQHLEKQSLHFASFYSTSKDSQNTAAQEDLARLYYQQKMDHVVSSLEFVPEDQLEEAHNKAIDEALLELSQAYPLTLELVESIRASLKDLFDKYTNLNQKKKDSQSRYAIGIDLGTSYSCVAYVGERGIEFIPDLANRTFIPSCLTFEENDDMTFGHTAQEKAYLNPENNVFDVKRMIGRHILNPQVAQLKKFWPFRASSENGSIFIHVLGKKYRPEQLVTFYVKHLIENTNNFLNQDIINAVVAIPAYFTSRQRHLTKEALQNAGINVLRLLNEPTAAALAYSDMSTDGSNKTCLIFDLGGGTFDLAILEMDSNQVKIKAVDGDPFLGGVDFDNDLMKYCIEKFELKQKVRFREVGKYSKNMRRLKKQCEKIKEELSFTKKAKVTLDAIDKDMDLVVTVERSTFESLIEEKLKKCMAIVGRICETVEVKIAEVVLVGGSSRIPRVLELLKEKFGEAVSISKRLHPEEAVARGAALLATSIQNQDTNLFIQEMDKRILV